MRRLLGVFMLAVISFSSILQAAEEGKLGEGMVNPGYHEKPDWFKTSFLDIREERGFEPVRFFMITRVDHTLA